MVVLSLIALVVAIGIIAVAAFKVKQQERYVVERFGRFLRIAEPGINFKIPFIDTIAKRIGLWLEQNEITVTAKTRDNSFIELGVMIQRRPIDATQETLYNVTYKLDDADAQIDSYVKSLVISRTSTMDLDEVFAKRDETAGLINDRLNAEMQPFGWLIEASQIIAITPSEKIVAAMNEIVASQRLKVAAENKGEADKILRVKAAEAERQANILHGEGVAGQRTAIIEGLRDAIKDFAAALGGEIGEREIITLVQLIQYMDMMKSIGTNNTVILGSHMPGGLPTLTEQIQTAIFGTAPPRPAP